MLTKRQKQTLEFIKSYIKKNDFAPSLEEIKAHLKLSSVSTAHHHVKALEDQGYLRKEDNVARAIDVAEPEQMIQIPIMGLIAAGFPIEAIEQRETIAIPKTKLPKSGQFYALKVAGNSMVEENINDGDIVVIKQQDQVENGQKAVALIDNSEVTLKKIYKEKSCIRLQPANHLVKPMYYNAERVAIQGILIDVVRNTQEDFSVNIDLNNTLNNSEYIQPNAIICGDALDMLKKIKPNSIDLVLSDIPYGISLDEWDVLHSNTNSALLGQSPAQIGKKAFKRRGKPINGWSSADKNIPLEYQQWCYSWGKKLFPLVKEGGSVFIFGARRTIHRAVIALEDSGFLVRDVLAWEKPNAHHRAQSLSKIFYNRGLYDVGEKWEGWKLGNLAPKYEPIAWLFKPYKITIADNVLKNKLGAMNIEACLIGGKSPTNILRYGFDKNESGFHEAQKPVKLLEYLIKLVTIKGQTVLDPFIGSGSTLVAAKRLDRKYIGFDKSDEYCKISNQRIDEDNHDPEV
ncbi:hypothetical protein COT78_02650 [Candidatus Berkelbacteria bacterium CG10_big_fil_rev_8_21_14_0_10_43_13]|uniref:LexA repressor n=1 Tax=Candidatus Berkelbacteria bacterium CG10_big_fil_rev_8_21_14_0_10_43_13 TaxID=1974514 RepID=A0A2H0W6E4_9BACT|nr:MAG: hypothetical protein COT78_02650 [Candidatus Berkelbacteria bacterium CG10_big_fil_rev_8_21_14_0_10_43_13]